jgi:hypothetical protein
MLVESPRLTAATVLVAIGQPALTIVARDGQGGRIEPVPGAPTADPSRKSVQEEGWLGPMEPGPPEGRRPLVMGVSTGYPDPGGTSRSLEGEDHHARGARVPHLPTSLVLYLRHEQFRNQYE